MHIAVIGSGYVGLVAGACFADVGNDVVCVDNNPAKVEMLSKGRVPIYEPGLPEVVRRNLHDKRLTFTSKAHQAISHAEVVFIAVGTPPGEDGSADLQYVLAVAETIADAVSGESVVVCKSTVPVGTCDRVHDLIASRTKHLVHVVSNPEFLKEGSALKDFASPDRVVIGCSDKSAGDKVASLYAPFMRRSERIMRMDLRSAEMTKYASNAMLATKISFMNEIANLCDAVGADVELVRRGMAMDDRIGPHFIYPGVGYGGSCFPKDVRALAYLGEQNGKDVHMLRAVESVNNAQKLRLLDLARGYFRNDLAGKTFAIWGLSFKPKTDDIREAPALIAIRQLVHAGAKVRVTDPIAMENARVALAELGECVVFVEDNYETCASADALFVFTEWNEFRSPDFNRIKARLNNPVIFDGRNIYSRKEMQELGFDYFCIGRATADPAW